MKKLLLTLTVAVLSSFAGDTFAAGGKAPIDIPGIIITPPGHDGGSGGGGGHHNSITCVSKNSATKRAYVAKGLYQSRIQTRALEACLDKAYYANRCGNATCENQRVRSNIEVVAQNSSTRRSYHGRANTRVEAKAIAMNKCLSSAYYASRCNIVR